MEACVYDIPLRYRQEGSASTVCVDPGCNSMNSGCQQPFKMTTVKRKRAIRTIVTTSKTANGITAEYNGRGKR